MKQDLDQGAGKNAAAPIGHPDTQESRVVNHAADRARMSSDLFVEHLRNFVGRWAPEDPQDRDQFQHDLTRIFVDAMRNQTDHVSYGFEIYASDVFRQRAMAPLNVIFENPRKDR